MRLKGVLDIYSDEVGGRFYLEVPYIEMPLYPIGTELELITIDKKVVLAAVYIERYVADTERGTKVICHYRHSARPIAPLQELSNCSIIDSRMKYSSLVDFSKC